MKYSDFYKKRQEIVNSLPLYWAFGRKQFDRLIKELGFKDENEFNENMVGYLGAAVRKTDIKDVKSKMKAIYNEFMDLVKTDDEFIYTMFLDELNNHEYSYTLSVGDTLDALGFTKDEIYEDERLFNALQRAKKKIIKDL